MVEAKMVVRLKQQAERAKAEVQSKSPYNNMHQQFGQSQLSSYNLSPSMHDRATGFFFSNYVIDAEGPTEGHFDGLSKAGYDIDEHLLASIKAVGLAGVSGAASAPALMRDARKQYTTAIRLTNK